MIQFNYNDGGRAKAGYKGHTGDCVVRSVAIASGVPYEFVYNYCHERMKAQRRSKREVKRGVKTSRSPTNGVSTNRKWFSDYMEELGFEWFPTMAIGSGCKVHLRGDELPPGNLVVSVSKHYCAVIDGVLNDTYDCSRGGTRCVYGYWKKMPEDQAKVLILD